jgi:hypothetical protein
MDRSFRIQFVSFLQIGLFSSLVEAEVTKACAFTDESKEGLRGNLAFYAAAKHKAAKYPFWPLPSPR